MFSRRFRALSNTYRATSDEKKKKPIPFALPAANVAVNDTSEWTYGPEYAYSVNMTYVVKPDPNEPPGTIQLMSAIKCRPMVSDSLQCRLANSTTTVLVKQNMTRAIETEQLFEIKFNERGVAGLLIDSPSRNEVVNLIRKIANQFSLGADMKRKIAMSQFMARENTSMGDCATTYRITREERPAARTSPAATSPGDDVAPYRLVVLPMTDARPGTSLTIEKSRMGCINPPRYVDFSAGILKMVRAPLLRVISFSVPETRRTELNVEPRVETNRASITLDRFSSVV